MASEKVYHQLPQSVQAATSQHVSALTSEELCDNLDQVKAIQQFSKNCADCDAPEPDWVSINLGVFICIDCAGVHRSLGAHISKVRSITLDRWEPEAVQVSNLLPFAMVLDSLIMQFLEGKTNNEMNCLFEKDLPDGLKPTPTATRLEREAFIRNKYEHLQYADKNHIDQFFTTDPSL
jgi:hypothetical protein